MKSLPMREDIIFFNSRDELLRIEASKIVYFEASGNYTTIATMNNMKILLRINLGGMEKLLEERLKERARIFARIGKSYIINLRCVAQVCLLRHKLVLSDFCSYTFTLDISKEALRNLKNVLITVK